VTDLRRWIERVVAAVLVVVAGLVLAAVALLAVVHVDDRYGVSAASGVWMGLSSALQHGVVYPAVYADGFYGGTRYMPLPFVLQAVANAVAGELLVSTKLVIYACACALYVLVFVVMRRRGAPWPVALALVAAVLATFAGGLTTLGIRWDTLATLLQVGAIALVASRPVTPRRAGVSGLLCALGVAAKFSALWAPAAIVVWLAFVARRSLVWFLAVLLGAAVLFAAMTEAASSGRFYENLRLFGFGGSDFAGRLDGVHRLYYLGLRDQREGAMLLLLAGAAVVVAVVRRRVTPWEIAFVACIGVLAVVFRDQGAYENHLVDLLVLAAIVASGAWTAFPEGRRADITRIAVVGAILLATVLASRYTIRPDARAALSHEARGRVDERFAIDDLSRAPLGGRCDLYEDSSIPLMAGFRPFVLDAFMVHRLQTRRSAELNLLVDRIRRGEFPRLVLSTTLDALGWFAVLDFGSRLADAMRAGYRPAEENPGGARWIYVPRKPPAQPFACTGTSLRDWR